MNIKELKATLEANPEMAKAFDAALTQMTPETAGSEAEAFSKAAAAVGLEISPEEVERALASEMEIEDSELDMVAGGMDCNGEDPVGHDNFCNLWWHCHNIVRHTDEANENTDCFSDYACEISYYKSGTAQCGATHRSEQNCILTWFHR